VRISVICAKFHEFYWLREFSMLQVVSMIAFPLADQKSLLAARAGQV
jgi:hypothetical protein